MEKKHRAINPKRSQGKKGFPGSEFEQRGFEVGRHLKQGPILK